MENHKNRGFTLLEILIVLGIIALLFTLIIPRAMTGNNRYTLSSAARDIASAMRYTRAFAVESHTDKAIKFNLYSRSYTMDGDSKVYSLEEGIEIEVFTAETEISNNEQQASIRFYPDGASTGGRIKLVYEEDIKEIDVVWMTGQINLLKSFD